MEKLAAAEKKFSESLPPIEALRAWMLFFLDYIATKDMIAPALNTLVGGASKLYERSRGQIQGAIDALVKHAIKSGDIRRDLDPSDLLRSADRRLKRVLQARLAAKGQETGGHPRHGFAANQIERILLAKFRQGIPVVCQPDWRLLSAIVDLLRKALTNEQYEVRSNAPGDETDRPRRFAPLIRREAEEIGIDAHDLVFFLNLPQKGRFFPRVWGLV